MERAFRENCSRGYRPPGQRGQETHKDIFMCLPDRRSGGGRRCALNMGGTGEGIMKNWIARAAAAALLTAAAPVLAQSPAGGEPGAVTLVQAGRLLDRPGRAP